MLEHQIRIHQQGAPSVLRYEALDAPLPAPGEGQVVLRQEAVGVNFVDTMFRDGTFPVTLPYDMGVEAAGVVTAVGPGVANLTVGDRVAYFFAPGAYATARLIDAAGLVRLPDDVTTRQAAAMLAKGLTAWMAVKGAHTVMRGEVVYVNGASGGVGLLVAQWAAALGALVIAAVGSPEKISAAQRHGLKHVVATSSPGFASDVRALTGGKEIDTVYEFIGRATIGQSVQLLRNGGRFFHVGNASGPGKIATGELATRHINYARPSTPQYVDTPAAAERASKDLFDALRQGVFGTPDITGYPLADAARAHEDIAARRHRGFAVLIP